MIRRVWVVLVFFSPKRVLKFVGFCGGKHRARPELHMAVAVATTGLLVVACVGAMTLLHLPPFTEVPR